MTRFRYTPSGEELSASLYAEYREFVMKYGKAPNKVVMTADLHAILRARYGFALELPADAAETWNGLPVEVVPPESGEPSGFELVFEEYLPL